MREIPLTALSQYESLIHSYKSRIYVQKMIEIQNSVTEWDDTLWVIFLDSAIVNTDGTIEFCFKDGAKIPV